MGSKKSGNLAALRLAHSRLGMLRYRMEATEARLQGREADDLPHGWEDGGPRRLMLWGKIDGVQEAMHELDEVMAELSELVAEGGAR